MGQEDPSASLACCRLFSPRSVVSFPFAIPTSNDQSCTSLLQFRVLLAVSRDISRVAPIYALFDCVVDDHEISSQPSVFSHDKHRSLLTFPLS